MWFTIASMLATMNITKGVDENGAVIEPSGEYESAMTQSVSPHMLLSSLLTGGSSAVKPFACSVNPGSRQTVDLIRSISLDA